MEPRAVPPRLCPQNQHKTWPGDFRLSESTQSSTYLIMKLAVNSKLQFFPSTAQLAGTEMHAVPVVAQANTIVLTEQLLSCTTTSMLDYPSKLLLEKLSRSESSVPVLWNRY